MKKVSYWIHHTHLFSKDEYECSVCGASYSKPYNVCPNCNTPMDGQSAGTSWVDEAEILDIIDHGL